MRKIIQGSGGRPAKYRYGSFFRGNRRCAPSVFTGIQILFGRIYNVLVKSIVKKHHLALHLRERQCIELTHIVGYQYFGLQIFALGSHGATETQSCEFSPTLIRTGKLHQFQAAFPRPHFHILAADLFCTGCSQFLFCPLYGISVCLAAGHAGTNRGAEFSQIVVGVAFWQHGIRNFLERGRKIKFWLLLAMLRVKNSTAKQWNHGHFSQICRCYTHLKPYHT